MRRRVIDRRRSELGAGTLPIFHLGSTMDFPLETPRHDHLHAPVFFLARDALYAEEKPYTLQYRSSTIPKSNVRSQHVGHLDIKDLRNHEHEYSFEANGIAVVEMESAMTYEDFEDAGKVNSTYIQEIVSCLFQQFEAANIQVFDWVVSLGHARVVSLRH